MHLGHAAEAVILGKLKHIGAAGALRQREIVIVAGIGSPLLVGPVLILGIKRADGGRVHMGDVFGVYGLVVVKGIVGKVVPGIVGFERTVEIALDADRRHVLDAVVHAVEIVAEPLVHDLLPQLAVDDDAVQDVMAVLVQDKLEALPGFGKGARHQV